MKPITESLEITRHFRDLYPSLWQTSLSQQIDALLTDLHNLNYFSLTYSHKLLRATDMEKAVLQRLANPDITSRYRQALEFKLKVWVLAELMPVVTLNLVAGSEAPECPLLKNQR